MKKTKNTSQDVTVSALKRRVSRSPVTRFRIKLATYSGAFKRFFHEYRLPMTASLLFIGLLLIFSTMRLLERTSTLALRNDVSEGGDGYSILLSADEADQFNRRGTDEPDDPSTNNVSISTNSTQSTSNSFTIPGTDNSDGGSSDSGGDDGDSGGDAGGDTGGGDTGGGDTGGGDTGGGDTGGGDDPPDPPVIPFDADINSFSQGSVTLQCANPKNPRKNNCSKVYSFSGSIIGTNGPGAVSYSWQSNLSEGNGSGSFQASGGTSLTAVNKEITLACKTGTNFTIQLAIISPSLVTSNTINVNHNCNEL